jgi:cardiolipin synthase
MVGPEEGENAMPDMSISFWAILEIALVAYWIGVSVLVIAQDREPTATLAWLLVLFAMPFLGLVVYFFFGRDWPHNIQRAPATHRLQEIIGRFMPSVYAPFAARSREFVAGLDDEHERIARVAERKLGVPVLPVRTCDLYGSGEEYFDVLVADLASAKRFIHMNYFIWGKDELTARITRVLLDRLAAGVEVRILNDLVGCIAYSKSELHDLRRAGAKVGWDLAQLARVNYRNHRKITVVDAEIGHSGGFNVGQEYIDGGKRFPAWRDTGIRITGPAVADLEKLFDMRWYEVFGEDLFQTGYYPDASLPPGDTMVQTVHQGFDDPWNAATRAHQLAISGARSRVLIQSPYVVPDQTTLDVIKNAAAGGVRVDFMTTGWLDKHVPWWAAESYFERMLQAGVHIWLWEKGFVHAKTLTVDGEACAIGTLNLDMRSLRINKELMVWVYDAAVARESERLFEEDLRDCREVTLDEIRSWSRLRRFRNSSARLLSNLL